MILQKNNIKYKLQNAVQIAAFKKNGWVEVMEESTNTNLFSKDIKDMSTTQLKEYAKNYNIDLLGETTKIKIIEIIQQQRSDY